MIHMLYSDHKRCDSIYILTDKGVEECITNDICWDINTDGNWIYYRNQSDFGNLYRINILSKEKQRLAVGNITNINIIGNRVFFRRVTENVGYFVLLLDDDMEEIKINSK